MPLVYLDASIVVAAVVREESTDRVQRALERQRAENLAISGWVLTEFSSALALIAPGRRRSGPVRRRP